MPCIQDLLASATAGHTAIAAPGRKPLTFGGLQALVDRTVAALNDLGIGRNDRVAILLPNGPEMAAAFVAIGAGATTAPLNPAYRADEFEFYLTDLKAKALLVDEPGDSPAVAIANKLGVPIIRLHAEKDKEAGLFTLLADGGARTDRASAQGYAAAGDVALVLHTSGTTSSPKIVPLTQANICASARHIGRTLELGPSDQCLNIMPLFHIHGLIGGVLSSLSAGASVFCTPGFNALRFYVWLDEAHPSWFTAVPTMLQAIHARASQNRPLIDKTHGRLRFIRSSSASLPPQVMLALEETFGVPVIESYGMTEAAHQMASNPLPPGERRPGSVGLAAGPEVAIMDDTGTLLAAESTGEVVIRGPNVTGGYEANPEANKTAYSNGWFRTGDQGYMDPAGYLFITGRLKEIINRGGEKVSPREVDEVLLDHPAVEQVVTFAMPHKMLGEDVAAVVVLRQGQTASEQDLRAFLAERLAAFKVPRKIVFVSEIPKGATGRLQRIGLADKLGL